MIPDPQLAHLWAEAPKEPMRPLVKGAFIAGLCFFVGLVLALMLGAFTPAAADHGDPADSEHAAACVQSGGKVYQHRVASKVAQPTYWCLDDAGRITDLWFSNGESYRQGEAR